MPDAIIITFARGRKRAFCNLAVIIIIGDKERITLSDASGDRRLPALSSCPFGGRPVSGEGGESGARRMPTNGTFFFPPLRHPHSSILFPAVGPDPDRIPVAKSF